MQQLTDAQWRGAPQSRHRLQCVGRDRLRPAAVRGHPLDTAVQKLNGLRHHLSVE
ncbi:hypothetical protein ABN584_11565 [Gloeocapsa sp. BRSZ]